MKYASDGKNGLPLSDWYDTNNGTQMSTANNFARPVVGGHLALVRLPGCPACCPNINTVIPIACIAEGAEHFEPDPDPGWKRIKQSDHFEYRPQIDIWLYARAAVHSHQRFICPYYSGLRSLLLLALTAILETSLSVLGLRRA